MIVTRREDTNYEGSYLLTLADMSAGGREQQTNQSK